MTRSWRKLSLGASAAALAAGGAGAALLGIPVAGASGAASALVPTGAGRTFATVLAPATVKNTEEAGYRVTNSAGITNFVATVTVPTLSCPSTGTLSGYFSSQIVGTTGSGGSFVHVACAAGAATYGGFITWTTVTTGTKHFLVAPGDKLQTTMTVTTTKKDVTHVHTVVDDETSGVVTSLWVKYAGGATDTTGWDVFEHLGATGVPPFGTASWSDASSNGLSLQSAGATHVNMTQTGVTLVSTSALGSTGASFKNVFHTSS